MSDSITVTIAPEPDGVRLLATTPTRDRLKAILGPIRGAPPRAASTLLEGLALWHQRALSVVSSADDAGDGSALGLCDALGFGRTLHYEVGLVFPERRARGHRRRRDLRGLGDFRDMRQLALWGDAMTVSPAVAAEIRRLYFAEHWKRGTIAAQRGVHSDTVVRVLGSFGPKAGTPRPDARVLEPYVPFVDETLSRHPRLVATRIYDMLVARGYSGSIKTLRRYVRVARPTPRNEVYLRVETLPGEQAQVDWAHVGSLAVPGGKRPLWAFVMVLAYSRAIWAELVVELGVELGAVRSFASMFFGGSPGQWLFDNAKTVVVERVGDAIRFHPALLDLAARLHVQPALCAPRRPTDKGKVERAIRYLKERFFAARSFHSVAQGTRSSPISSRPSRTSGLILGGPSDASSTSSRRSGPGFSLSPIHCPRQTS